ncbi:MAG TPA: VOC family protein [Sphingobium sp.]|nr:VOC family protein [Sphingobium sp.]
MHLPHAPRIRPSRLRHAAGLSIAALILGMPAAALAQPPVKRNLPKVEHPAPIVPNSVGIFGLEHTHIITADIDRCIEFYTKILGFTLVAPVRDMPDNKLMQEMLGVPNAHFRQAMLNIPGGPSYGTHVPMIEIWEITNSTPLDKTLVNNPAANLQGKGYNAYRVTDLNALVARLTAAGVKFVSKTIWNGTQGGIYAIDPDGQIVELDQYED